MKMIRFPCLNTELFHMFQEASISLGAKTIWGGSAQIFHPTLDDTTPSRWFSLSRGRMMSCNNWPAKRICFLRTVRVCWIVFQPSATQNEVEVFSDQSDTACLQPPKRQMLLICTGGFAYFCQTGLKDFGDGQDGHQKNAVFLSCKNWGQKNSPSWMVGDLSQSLSSNSGWRTTHELRPPCRSRVVTCIHGCFKENKLHYAGRTEKVPWRRWPTRLRGTVEKIENYYHIIHIIILFLLLFFKSS